MRTSVLISLVLLVVIAFLGVGGTIWIITTAMDATPPTRDPSIAHLTTVLAVYAGAIPFLIATVALGAVGIIGAINQQREEQVTWLAHIGRAGGAR